MGKSPGNLPVSKSPVLFSLGNETLGRREMTPGDPMLHWRAHPNNNIFYSIDLLSKNTSQVRKNPSGSPSSPPRDTNLYVNFASLRTKVGREGKAPSMAPGGAGQAAKLCPPTMSLLSPGEHSLLHQTLLGWDGSCPQPQHPLQLPREAQSSFSPSKLPVSTRKMC